MRQLLLLRHAMAAPAGPDMPDHSRALAPEGRDACILMRDEMRRRRLAVDLVLVSSARRTMQTMLGVAMPGVAPAITPGQVEPMDLLYLASAAEMLGILRQVTPTLRSALLVAHNPGLYDMALGLTAGGVRRSTAQGAAALLDGYATLGLAHFVFDGEWDALDWGGARLMAYVTPRELAARAGK